MKLLAIDSACKSAGVALFENETLLYEVQLHQTFTHSETLLPLCVQALQMTHLSLTDLDAFAVNLGPGSFTGLRIGLAAVKGLCFSQQKPCIGVSTLEALAYHVPLEGSLLCALDARRNEVYYACFERKQGIVQRISTDSSDVCTNLIDIAARLPQPLFLVGDGAHLVYDAIHAHVPCQIPAQPFQLSGAVGVGLCALEHRQEAVSSTLLSPAYLRLSQAERERLQRSCL